MKVLTFSLITLLMLLMLNDVLALEIPLHYERFSESENVDVGYFIVSLSNELPSGDWGVPVFNTNIPLYGLITIGSSQRLFILDRQNISKSHVIYDRMYFDANGNRDLTDDPVLDGVVFDMLWAKEYSVQLPSTEMTFEIEGKSFLFSFKPKVISNRAVLTESTSSLKSFLKKLTMQFNVNCAYVGYFTLDGKKYKIAFIDTNGNGIFDEKSNNIFFYRPNSHKVNRYEILSDAFAISNREDIHYKHDSHIYGDLLSVNGKMFEMKLDMKNGKCILSPILDNLIQVKMNMKIDHLTFYSESTNSYLNIYQSGDVIKVHKGNYRLLKYSAFRYDEQGDRWWLQTCGTNISPSLQVDGSNQSTFMIGEPYRCVIEIANASRNKISNNLHELLLNMMIMGKNNELVTDICHIKGNNTQIQLSNNLKIHPKEPDYKIVKSDGEIVTQGAFRYG